MRAFPKTTSENVAACAALGVEFWSLSIYRSCVWAVIGGGFALVRIDRRGQTAQLMREWGERLGSDNRPCYRMALTCGHGFHTIHQPTGAGRRVSFDPSDTVAALTGTGAPGALFGVQESSEATA